MVLSPLVVTKVCAQGGARALYVSSYATQPVLEKGRLVIPARQFLSASCWLGGWIRSGPHFSETGLVAYEDTYRALAPAHAKTLVVTWYSLLWSHMVLPSPNAW